MKHNRRERAWNSIEGMGNGPQQAKKVTRDDSSSSSSGQWPMQIAYVERSDDIKELTHFIRRRISNNPPPRTESPKSKDAKKIKKLKLTNHPQDKSQIKSSCSLESPCNGGKFSALFPNSRVFSIA